MSRICFARSLKKYRNLTCIGVVLASVGLTYGCISTTLITKNYEHRIRMTKQEAVQFLKQYLRKEKNLSVDENHLAFTYSRKVIDIVTTKSGLGMYGYGTITTTTHYDVFADIEFARVVKIRKVSFPSEEFLYVYDNNGIDLSRGGGFGWSHIDDKFISALLALCPKVESSSSNADPSDEIHQAIVQRNSPKLLSMLEKNPELVSLKTDYGTPLYIAAESGNKNAAVLLIEKGAKVDEIIKKIGGEFTSLYIAAGNGHKDVVEFLLAKGADINAKTDRGFTPLHIAAFNNHRDVVEFLIAKGAQVNAKSKTGLTPLYSTSEKNSTDVAKILITKGAEIDAMDTNGLSPLHIAALNGYRDFVELLIARGARVNAKSNSGITPLYSAAEKNHLDVAKLLINHKADVKLEIKNGWTPLHISTWENHRDMVEFLIINGADVNAKNKDGLTPLHIAVEKNNIDMATLLILRGANINAKNKNDWTPLYVATKKRQWEMANLLRKNGGIE